MMRGFPAFVARAVRAQYTSIPPREVFVPQFVDAGYGSLMLLTILTFFAGLNLAVQSFGPFSRIGAQDMLGMFAGRFPLLLHFLHSVLLFSSSLRTTARALSKGTNEAPP